MLAQLPAGSASTGSEQPQAAVRRQHRVVRLVEADRVVGRGQLGEAPSDLGRVDRLVHHPGAGHRLAELGHVVRVGRAEVEAAAHHRQLLAGLVAEDLPECERGARELDVVLALVRQPDHPRRAVRAALAVSDAARLEQQHVVAAAGEVVRGREAHHPAADDDHLARMLHCGNLLPTAAPPERTALPSNEEASRCVRSRRAQNRASWLLAV